MTNTPSKIDSIMNTLNSYLVRLITLETKLECQREKLLELSSSSIVLSDKMNTIKISFVDINNILKNQSELLDKINNELFNNHQTKLKHLQESTLRNFIKHNWWRIGALIAILGIFGDIIIYLSKIN